MMLGKSMLWKTLIFIFFGLVLFGFIFSNFIRFRENNKSIPTAEFMEYIRDKYYAPEVRENILAGKDMVDLDYKYLYVDQNGSNVHVIFQYDTQIEIIIPDELGMTPEELRKKIGIDDAMYIVNAPYLVPLRFNVSNLNDATFIWACDFSSTEETKYYDFVTGDEIDNRK